MKNKTINRLFPNAVIKRTETGYLVQQMRKGKPWRKRFALTTEKVATMYADKIAGKCTTQIGPDDLSDNRPQEVRGPYRPLISPDDDNQEHWS